MSAIASELLSRMNERRVLEYLQRHGPSSRSEIGRGSGLSNPTVAKASDALIERGLLEEAAPRPEAFGRPAKTLRLSRGSANVIGVVIDTRCCTVDRATLDGVRHDASSKQFATPLRYQGLIDEIERCVLEIRECDRSVQFRAIGLSVPGQLNLRTAQIETSPNVHLLDGQSLRRDLEKRLGLDCVVLQESHALCLGERFFGAARDLDHFALLDLSTGLGMGVMSGGQLLVGSSGLAGEIGHITIDPHGIQCGCGNKGCLETLATDSAFARRALGPADECAETEVALDHYRAGEVLAREAAASTVEWMAVAMAAVINIFNPSTLLVHSRLLHIDRALFERAVEIARQRSLRASFRDCQIQLATADKRRGAVAGVIQHLNDCMAPSVALLKHSVAGRTRFLSSNKEDDHE